MKERIESITVPGVYPGASSALGANYVYWITPYDMTIIAVSAAPSANETGGSIDINDDGTGVIAAVDCSDQDVPGTWLSTAVGGTNAPVHVAAGSKLSIDANSFENGIQACIVIKALTSEVNA